MDPPHTHPHPHNLFDSIFLLADCPKSGAKREGAAEFFYTSSSCFFKFIEPFPCGGILGGIFSGKADEEQLTIGLDFHGTLWQANLDTHVRRGMPLICTAGYRRWEEETQPHPEGGLEELQD